MALRHLGALGHLTHELDAALPLGDLDPRTLKGALLELVPPPGR